MNNLPITGHHYLRYRVNTSWSKANPATHPVNDCHEMAVDKQGRIFLLTNDTRNNILIYDQAGNLLDSWGSTYPGAHGLTLFEQDGEEFLLITDTERHQVIKTDLSGNEIMMIDAPEEIDNYKLIEQFKPTETAVAPNGDIYVTDGYGLQFVIQYDLSGNYIRHFGGKGDADAQFDCVHGIALDFRHADSPILIITSRNHNAFKKFSLDGHYLGQVMLPGSFVCRPVIKGDLLYAAVFRSGTNTNSGSGYVLILDKNFHVVSAPGATAPVYENGVLQEQQQAEKIFIHPHDVCVDDDGNIMVCQWKSDRTYPIKLEKII